MFDPRRGTEDCGKLTNLPQEFNPGQRLSSYSTVLERNVGILDEISSAGVFLRGLDLNAFDGWVSAIIHQEPFVGFGDLFFPMWRVERISKDEASGGVPSLCEQVERRTGQTIKSLVDM